MSNPLVIDEYLSGFQFGLGILEAINSESDIFLFSIIRELVSFVWYAVSLMFLHRPHIDLLKLVDQDIYYTLFTVLMGFSVSSVQTDVIKA